MPLSERTQRALSLQNLRVAQDVRKFTDTQMAGAVDWPRERFSRTVNGHLDLPTHKAFRLWARLLNVPVAAILPAASLDDTLQALGVTDLRRSFVVQKFFDGMDPQLRQEVGLIGVEHLIKQDRYGDAGDVVRKDGTVAKVRAAIDDGLAAAEAAYNAVAPDDPQFGWKRTQCLNEIVRLRQAGNALLGAGGR